MAFVIIAAGPVTGSTLRTIGAGRAALAATVALLLLVAASVGLGYGLASLRAAPGPTTSAGATTRLDQADGRVVARHLGALAGRLTRLESEAAALARRLGVDERPAAAAAASTGGPLVPLAGLAAPTASRSTAGAIGTPDPVRVESQLTRLEDDLARLADAVAAREVETMAYPYRLPVAGAGSRVSSAYGVRHDPFTGRLARHTGLDIPAPHGTPILASGGGRVVVAGYKGAYGRAVVIDHGDGLATLYGHASKLLVRAGDVVMPNQPIALVGSTGRSTGPHLHFEVLRRGVRVEPRQYLSHVLAPGPAR